MKPWADLYRSHRGMRLQAGAEATKTIRLRLKALADRGLCDGTLPFRFTYEKNERSAHVRAWRITGNGESGEPLKGLPHLKDARLTVLLLTGTRQHELHELTIMLEGRTLEGTSWCVALHLPDDRESARPDGDRQGSGACGHAAFHCHVGPTLDAEPKVRVPLPPLHPADALDWVLSQVVPGYEPAPWSDVEAARSASGS